MNLTDEQIEAAAKAMYCSQEMVVHVTSGHPLSWESRTEGTKSGYRTMARSAAKFLQMPWEMPTEAECREFHALTDREVAAVLGEFVECRNASLIPKPVDPRREKILSVIRNPQLVGMRVHVNDVADRILAALDAKE